MSEEELISVLTSALLHAVVTLQGAPELAEGLGQVHEILRDNGLKFNSKGDLVSIRRIGFIQHD